MLRAANMLEFPNPKVPGTKLEYELMRCIGEGTFARVYLVREPRSRREYAAKIVQKQGDSVTREIQREITIHSSLSHANIIRLVSTHEDKDYIYMLMEFASGGELFDRITPDVGVDEDVAHFYFVQLINAIEHIHSQGIVHRDLKPENMLLDEYGNLKLTDFGLATVFSYKGRRRAIKTPCGTPPYVAPEIHDQEYEAEPVDVWSAGVILYVMLSGNTPWDEPTANSPEFRAYCTNHRLNFDPWTRFPPQALALLRGMLCINPVERFTLKHVKDSAWYRRPNPIMSNGKLNDPAYLMARLNAANVEDSIEDNAPIAYSQPEIFVGAVDSFNERPIPSFSQPAFRGHDEDMAMTQPTQSMGSLSQAQARITADRLMRFFSPHTATDTYRRLATILDDILVPYKAQNNNTKITFSTIDKRKCPLKGEIRIQQVSVSQTLVHFKKTKGDALEARRFFRHCNQAYKAIAEQDREQDEAMDLT